MIAFAAYFLIGFALVQLVVGLRNGEFEFSVKGESIDGAVAHEGWCNNHYETRVVRCDAAGICFACGVEVISFHAVLTGERAA